MDITNHDGQLSSNPLVTDFGNFVILLGNNNAGKTTLMRNMIKHRNDAYLVNSNRVNIQGEGAMNKGYIDSAQNYSEQIRDADSDNVVKNVQVLQDLFNLNDADRRKIIDYYNSNFPDKAQVKRENPANSASPRILTMNGLSITKQGSGARSMLEILVKLFDPTIQLLCIDEPEIALEPKLQKLLFRAIKAKTNEKQIVIATHSHHFIDAEQISNNYICARDRHRKIFVTKIESQLQIRNLIFDLLGNDLKDLGLPSKLIIAEGISDHNFLSKTLGLLGKNSYAVFDAGSDSKLKPAAEGISEYLKFVSDLAPVYKDKMWIISDIQRQNRDTRIREWRVALDDISGVKGRVCELSKNGIEYYYPENILQHIFNSTDTREQIIDGYLGSNPNSYNGLQITKKQLSAKVVDRLSASDLIAGNEIVDFINMLP